MRKEMSDGELMVEFEDFREQVVSRRVGTSLRSGVVDIGTLGTVSLPQKKDWDDVVQS